MRIECCFACDRRLGAKPKLVVTSDGRDDQGRALPNGQTVHVGRECFKLIEKAGAAGYQPPKGGPRLFVLVP